ncbi:hypothetical protein EIP91_009873 [Steccherinum ochraceum]|uniref:CCHC-type domain-containing protein n=1 Tax=Steccherinum ochraceum TaxID=92696 RepID=A0A4R0R3D6_9APHY|nr:hypothetical protein EIP91_009873 [Steccherinum ochraceum]
MAEPAVAYTRTTNQSMPVPEGRQAPTKFKGKPSSLRSFLLQFESLAETHKLTSAEKCEWVVEYCSTKVRNTIRGYENYRNGNWDGLKDDIKNAYDIALDTQPYQVINLIQLVRKTSRGSERKMASLSAWKKYVRNFVRIAGSLVQHDQITKDEYATYFWIGIPSAFQVQLENMIRNRLPTHDIAKPYPFEEIQRAAEHILHRNRFDKSRVVWLEDTDNTSGDDSSTEEESGESDSEDDMKTMFKKYMRKHKAKSSKDKASKMPVKSESKELTDSVHKMFADNPVQASAKDNKARAAKPSKATSQSEVESLIKQMGKLSISDPQYAFLWYQAAKLDPFVTQAFTSPLSRPASQGQTVRASSNVMMTEPLPPPDNMNMNNNMNNNMGMNNNGRNFGMRRQRPQNLGPPRCYGCGDIGHMVNECPALFALLDRKIVMRNNGQYTTPQGAPIFRAQGENWVQAIKRMVPPPPPVEIASHFLSIVDPDTETGTIQDITDVLAQYGTRSQVKAAADQQALEVGKKPAPTRGQKQKPLVPVDAIPSRFDPNREDIIMEDATAIKPTSAKTASKPVVVYPNTPAKEKVTPGQTPVNISPIVSGTPRAKRESAVSQEHKASAVVTKLLNTPINLSFGEVLGVSKDIAQEFQNKLRYHKTPAETDAATAAVQTSEALEGEVEVAANFSRALRRKLIRLPMQCNNINTVDFVLDTGSEINVISQDLWKRLGVPLDGGPEVILRDANGGLVSLNGIAHDLHMRYGPIETAANFYVSNRAPFVGLLGLPWMLENGVTLAIQPDNGEVHLTFAAYPEKIIILPGMHDSVQDIDGPIFPESFMAEIVDMPNDSSPTDASAIVPMEIGETPPTDAPISTDNPVSSYTDIPEIPGSPLLRDPEDMSSDESVEFVDASAQPPDSLQEAEHEEQSLAMRFVDLDIDPRDAPDKPFSMAMVNVPDYPKFWIESPYPQQQYMALNINSVPEGFVPPLPDLRDFDNDFGIGGIIQGLSTDYHVTYRSPISFRNFMSKYMYDTLKFASHPAKAPVINRPHITEGGKRVNVYGETAEIPVYVNNKRAHLSFTILIQDWPHMLIGTNSLAEWNLWDEQLPESVQLFNLDFPEHVPVTSGAFGPPGFLTPSANQLMRTLSGDPGRGPYPATAQETANVILDQYSRWYFENSPTYQDLIRHFNPRHNAPFVGNMAVISPHVHMLNDSWAEIPDIPVHGRSFILKSAEARIGPRIWRGPAILHMYPPNTDLDQVKAEAGRYPTRWEDHSGWHYLPGEEVDLSDERWRFLREVVGRSDTERATGINTVQINMAKVSIDPKNLPVPPTESSSEPRRSIQSRYQRYRADNAEILGNIGQRYDDLKRNWKFDLDVRDVKPNDDKDVNNDNYEATFNGRINGTNKTVFGYIMEPPDSLGESDTTSDQSSETLRPDNRSDRSWEILEKDENYIFNEDKFLTWKPSRPGTRAGQTRLDIFKTWCKTAIKLGNDPASFTAPRLSYGSTGVLGRRHQIDILSMEFRACLTQFIPEAKDDFGAGYISMIFKGHVNNVPVQIYGYVLDADVVPKMDEDFNEDLFWLYQADSRRIQDRKRLCDRCKKIYEDNDPKIWGISHKKPQTDKFTAQANMVQTKQETPETPELEISFPAPVSAIVREAWAPPDAQANVVRTVVSFPLLKIWGKFRDEVLPFVVDSGAQVNMIRGQEWDMWTARFAASGIPLPTLKASMIQNIAALSHISHKVRGVAVGLTVAVGTITTIGNFYIVDDLGNEAVFGLPWMIDHNTTLNVGLNGLGIKLSDIEGNHTYEISSAFSQPMFETPEMMLADIFTPFINTANAAEKNTQPRRMQIENLINPTESEEPSDSNSQDDSNSDTSTEIDENAAAESEYGETTSSMLDEFVTWRHNTRSDKTPSPDHPVPTFGVTGVDGKKHYVPVESYGLKLSLARFVPDDEDNKDAAYTSATFKGYINNKRVIVHGFVIEPRDISLDPDDRDNDTDELEDSEYLLNQVINPGLLGDRFDQARMEQNENTYDPYSTDSESDVEDMHTQHTS